MGVAKSYQANDPQAWLAAIVNSSDDAIVSKTLEGIITTWNRGAERIFGYTADEIVGKSILTIIPDDRHDEETMILSRLRKGERIDHFETIRRRKDGTLIEVSATISPVRDGEGRIVGVSKIARDITQNKQIQRELAAAKISADRAKEAAEKAQKEAERANKAKDHFLSVLSHELRTPLTPVLAAVSYIEKNESLPPFLEEQIGMIRRNVETEARLVDDLLDVTRISQGKLSLHFEAVDAQAVIRNVVAMLEKQLDDKSLAIRLSLRAKEHHIWADAGRFQQILLNLVSNAVKFTPEEGSIAVRTQNVNNELQIEIVDTGIGIEPEFMPRLFRAFEQGEKTFVRRFGGLGLGLSIVKSLIEMHKGSVRASSAGKGKGTTFTVRIPSTPAIRDAAKPGAGEKSNVKNLKILLVEDHSDTRQIMAKLLQSFGCRVSSAGSVKEAVELADTAAFDLLICDFGLPDGTGVDVMRHIHQRQEIKAIAMSGFGQEEDILRSKEAGFAVHLTKPINIQALQTVMEEIGNRSN